MMAHLNYEDEAEYIELVKTLIFKTFLLHVAEHAVRQLNRVLAAFYHWLEEYFLHLLAREKPGVLGLSVYRGNVPASLFILQRTRENYPHTRTVVGGAVFAQALEMGTPNFDRFLEETRDYLDKIIVGEGEILFLKFLEGELPQSQRVYTLRDIQSTILAPGSAKVPDFSDLDLRLYPNLASYASRSCPYQCSFCTETVYWGNYRKKPAAQVVKELTELYNRHRSQLFLMCDSLLNPVITDLANEIINSGVSLYWDGYFRVDPRVTNPGNILLWRQGGFYRARLGIESGSQHILDSMNKNITLEQVKACLFGLADAGIKTTTYWVVGYPGETEADFCKTLDILEELSDNIYEAECNIFAYFLTGQVNSETWRETHKPIRLYPASAKDLLMLETWILEGEPPREEAINRLSRFVSHCSRLDIPNPYSLNDIHKADERWKHLHLNAVPSLLEFKNKETYIDECRKARALNPAKRITAPLQSEDLELNF
jgi:radical SAM superfamily enzyme YgiQ (UPF0313 family)